MSTGREMMERAERYERMGIALVLELLGHSRRCAEFISKACGLGDFQWNLATHKGVLRFECSCGCTRFPRNWLDNGFRIRRES